MSDEMVKNYTINDLRYLMRRLRDPETGCPWDLKQTLQTITSHTIEEVYEVVDAIERNDTEHLNEELGDLLFQIIFYSQIGEEQGQFDFDRVTSSITDKLIRRHPHVFPEGTLESVRDNHSGAQIDDIKEVWESIKKQERENKGSQKVLDDIPLALPALSRALKLQKRAATVGFDWTDTAPVIDKINEELSELEAEIQRGDVAGVADELGDLLFSCVNLARHLKIDPETAMRHANEKFCRRFGAMEDLLGDKNINNHSVKELELLWLEVKKAE